MPQENFWTRPVVFGFPSAAVFAAHSKDDLHVLRRTYAAVRDLQVVECIGQLHSEKAGVGGSTPSLATTSFNYLANQPKISHL